MAIQKLFVQGMTRDSEVRITEALRQLEGVIFALANHQDQCVEVEFDDDRITSAGMREALADAGFDSRCGG